MGGERRTLKQCFFSIVCIHVACSPWVGRYNTPQRTTGAGKSPTSDGADPAAETFPIENRTKKVAAIMVQRNSDPQFTAYKRMLVLSFWLNRILGHVA